MSLERSFRRLAIQPSSLCRQCRRTYTSTPRRLQQSQGGSSAFDELLRASRNEEPTRQRRSASQPYSAAPAVATSAPPSSDPQTGATARRSSASIDFAIQSVRDSGAASRRAEQDQKLADLERTYARSDLERQYTRPWQAGDVYAPHDLSGVQMSKWKKFGQKPRPKRDVLDQLGINPLNHYKNISIMDEYVTDMGRIKHSRESGLRPVNQRKMAKAIRRAIGMGLMPSVYRHPELLRIPLTERGMRDRKR